MTDEYRALPLFKEHHTNFFSCGYDHLDRWLDLHALSDQKLGKSATHVWLDSGGCVVGYFTLLQTTIREPEGPLPGPSFLSRIRPPGFPRGDELPGVLIGKLALDVSLWGQGLGYDLLADAYVTSSEAVTAIGGAVLVVDPLNEKVAALYREFGFNSVDGSDRMVLNFREFNRGTPIWPFLGHNLTTVADKFR